MVAGSEMSALHFFQLGRYFPADVGDIAAAGMELAALWRVDGTWDIAFQDNRFLWL